MNSALLPAVVTLNSSIDSTDGNSSREGPPKRTRWDEMPSTENDVMNGSAPAMEIAPERSCWTPCASVATTIGLVLLVARKLSASLSMSSPDREWPIVDRSVSMTGCAPLTSTRSDVPAICSRHVDTHDLPRQQFNFANVVLKSLNADGQQIAAGVEVRNLKASLGVGDRLPLNAGRQVRGEHTSRPAPPPQTHRSRCPSAWPAWIVHGRAPQSSSRHATTETKHNRPDAFEGAAWASPLMSHCAIRRGLYESGVTLRCRIDFDRDDFMQMSHSAGYTARPCRNSFARIALTSWSSSSPHARGPQPGSADGRRATSS